MRLEAVTVCVNYADFLEVTARTNRGLFDRWVIVTKESDEHTREVCRRYDLETVLTNDFDRDGPGFNKARGVNRGLQLLSANCWHLHLDADIVLANETKNLLEAAHLNTAHIYGTDRVMCNGAEKYEQIVKSGWLMHDFHHRVSVPAGFSIGSRWVSNHHGYVPIGFFQLWHTDASEWHGIRQRRYPEHHSTAARCDVQFGLLWDRRQRECLPELLVLHLESEPAPMGANWGGRTTKPFGAAESPS